MKCLGIALTAATLSAVAAADPPHLRLWPGAKEATTEAVATIDASPAEVYAAATDFAHWRAIFSDVKSVSVKRSGDRDAVVELRSRALGHEVTIQFENDPGRAIRFRLVDGPPGARARGEYLLEADGPRTRLRATLYMDVVGAAGWFVSDATVTRMRDAKLGADLGDLVKWGLARQAAHEGGNP